MITTLVTWHALIGLQEVPTAPREPWKNYQNFENQIKLRDMIRQFDFEEETSRGNSRTSEMLKSKIF